ncbi:peroxiredoxin family protein [Streptosporangium roseum]|uniref:thioredoxin-dependent peroxiredoxin n=1 Tax=Streptosporangium roseum (strain ATCC 12428 / DSM 43021 / JCM 3005 / KCTC 9067 / NCIMB 10171 / NRRL 2505 / NI 9100) TaxID=479432 RepID=D2B669_STRRD|nr:peroxiredoxin family protein [Streptosporangium roseum]ACZ83782.1 peroxiredoxin [Streptosporangium roseum DSM 43021]
MLETGSPAPDVVLEDTDGKTVRLSDYQGRHAVLVYFMRATSCPICARHVQDLIQRRDEFAAGNIQVLVAVPEDRQAAAAWKAKRQIPFPVLIGRRTTPHEVVGLSRKVFGSMQQSGSVLIDSQGIVRHAHGATMPTSAYDRKGITAAVQALRTGG